MKLTREQAIAEFRKMWNWIADETERRNRVVEKIEYFEENGLEEVVNDCFLCEYDAQCDANYPACYFCPIYFGKMKEEDDYERACIDAEWSPYDSWQIRKENCAFDRVTPLAEKYGALAKYAREVANLPEREEQP